MKIAEKTTALETRVSWAMDHWGSFLSEMSPRDKHRSLETQTSANQVKSPELNAAKGLATS
jgi:hypothetical protein